MLCNRFGFTIWLLLLFLVVQSQCSNAFKEETKKSSSLNKPLVKRIRFNPLVNDGDDLLCLDENCEDDDDDENDFLIGRMGRDLETVASEIKTLTEQEDAACSLRVYITFNSLMVDLHKKLAHLANVTSSKKVINSRDIHRLYLHVTGQDLIDLNRTIGSLNDVILPLSQVNMDFRKNLAYFCSNLDRFEVNAQQVLKTLKKSKFPNSTPIAFRDHHEEDEDAEMSCRLHLEMIWLIIQDDPLLAMIIVVYIAALVAECVRARSFWTITMGTTFIVSFIQYTNHSKVRISCFCSPLKDCSTFLSFLCFRCNNSKSLQPNRAANQAPD